MVADGDGQDSGIGSDRNVVADAGRFPKRLVAPGRPAGGKQVVNEHHPVGDDAVVADGDQFAHKGVRLDLASLSDDDILLDLHKRADKRVIADAEPVKVGWLDDGDVVAELDVADLDGVYFGLGHGD